ncbi:MAG: DNA primase [Ruminococcaceae bacterium]|nr:DNA primase [Oscillospiraceae bacterium]
MEGNTDVIPREIIDEIVYRSDIEQVIGSYVTLKRAGSNCNGRCPFHSEKTPSFTVFPATRSFYCFGCGAGGDVITFTMRIENLDYIEAVKLLAARAGISIPEDRNDIKENNGVSRKRVQEMNLCAARFFRDCLKDQKYGAEGLRYLTEKRELSMATINHFGLGFAPDNFWALSNHMTSLGFTEDELVAAFLCGKSKKSGKLFDMYRNRVIFPIIDTTGNVIGFGGRVMDNSEPKYLNTNDTPAFKKRQNLFALNFAKKYAEERLILCEGYMDVIALHAAGFENAVATLGTAITPDQARIMAKYTKQVVICYDSDKAGLAADDKAIRLLSEVGIEARVLKVTGAKDPDEYIKKYGADNFRRLLGDTKGSFDYKLEKLITGRDISLPDEKIKISNDVCFMIADVNSSVERDIYVRRASELLGTTAEAMRSDVERIRKKKLRDFKNRQSSEAQMSLKNIGDRVNVDAAKNIRANSTEEGILGLMLMYEEFRSKAADGFEGLCADDFVTEFGRRVFEAMLELERSECGFSKAMLGQSFTPDEMGRIEKIELSRRNLAKNDTEVFSNFISGLKKEKSSNDDDNDPFAELMRLRAAVQKNKENKNI